MIAGRGLIGSCWTTAMQAVAALALASIFTLAQSAPAIYGDARVDKLLNQMTLAEKLTLIHDGAEDPKSNQGQAGYIGGIPRRPRPQPRAWPRPSTSASPRRTESSSA